MNEWTYFHEGCLGKGDVIYVGVDKHYQEYRGIFYDSELVHEVVFASGSKYVLKDEEDIYSDCLVTVGEDLFHHIKFRLLTKTELAIRALNAI